MDAKKTDSRGIPNKGQMYFGDRFWEQYVGRKILKDPIVALVELVANSWDAGAKQVKIDWPEDSNGKIIIADNGEGMTEAEFRHRWCELSYDRQKSQGVVVEVEVDGRMQRRPVFGRNGIGRFAAFCFASIYEVATTKEGEKNVFRVSKGKVNALDIELVSKSEVGGHGTSVEIQQSSGSVLPDESIRTELGRRFLIDPSFRVSINGVQIDFEDIRDKGLDVIDVSISELNTSIRIRVIDSRRTDRTIRQHGVAWHVLGRLVGDCDWKDPEQKSLIDGRRVEAKRFTFIIEADILRDTNAIKADWSGFDESDPDFQLVNAEVQKAVTQRLLEATREKRAETTNNVRSSFRQEMREMTPLKREKWNLFVEKVAEECPSITEQELKSVSGVLANMELASTQYGLLHKLHDLDPGQIDKLHEILDEWTVDMAKIVLDEIRGRMKLIEELRSKTDNKDALEVQELQPLFRQGQRWKF